MITVLSLALFAAIVYLVISPFQGMGPINSGKVILHLVLASILALAGYSIVSTYYIYQLGGHIP